VAAAQFWHPTGNHHDSLPSVDDNPAARRDAHDSDHVPVTAQLAI